jgi:redox-sensitive bicupin YhaK (pirin superfamily)
MNMVTQRMPDSVDNTRRVDVRQLLRTIDAVETSDGDGVKIHRIGGRQLNRVLDPFLMLDEINSDDATDYIGGFPEHPHRGFETISYMKVGRMRHRDHMGNEGVIDSGGVQWMTAGKGVIHSEMPEQDGGLLHGFQIWLNLPSSEKMQPAAYQDIGSADIPELNDGGGVKVRAIAGQVDIGVHQLTGPLPERSTLPTLLDVELRSDEKLDLKFSPGFEALVYVYGGSTNSLRAGQLGVFSKGDTLELNPGVSGTSLLVLSGRSIGEPIVQHGPFVMNTTAQIEQAVKDYQTNQFV